MKAERDVVNWIGLKFQSPFEVRDQWQSVQFSFYFLSYTFNFYQQILLLHLLEP